MPAKRSPRVRLSSKTTWQEQASSSSDNLYNTVVVSARLRALSFTIPGPNSQSTLQKKFPRALTEATSLPSRHSAPSRLLSQPSLSQQLIRHSTTWKLSNAITQFLWPPPLPFQHGKVQLGGQQRSPTAIILTASPPSSESITPGSASRTLLPAAVTPLHPKTRSKLKSLGGRLSHRV